MNKTRVHQQASLHQLRYLTVIFECFPVYVTSRVSCAPAMFPRIQTLHTRESLVSGFTQLHVVTSQFVMFLAYALHARR